ncbi:MAG: serine hydrolase domain-containing protein [Acidimicrobiales bacterium]
MELARIVAGWPGDPAVVVLRADGGPAQTVATFGDLEAPRPWASVSKLAVALAVGADVDAGRVRYEDAAGPPGATVAHLLSHSSGLGLEAGDYRRPVGTRRVYSNVGIDLVAQILAPAEGPARWIADRVLGPLGLVASDLLGRPSAGIRGSTRDLARLAAAFVDRSLLAPATHERIAAPYLEDLDGVVPGFGRFVPCPWGLGPELHGDKQHWMAGWPRYALGHFGRSGALVLADPVAQVAVAATSTVAFGPWAVAGWPQWLGEIRERALKA